MKRAALALAAAVALATSAAAAPPEVPVGFVYQGVLTDNLGNPRTGNVDLKVRIFDGGTGGTLLYMQSYSAVTLDAGTFSIVIGPTGAATDPPGPAPLTASLGTAVAGDLAATGPQRWIELQVGTSSALARTRLQSTPFALRATSSETSDFANEAGVAGDVDSVDGIPSEFVSQLWNNTNFDNNGPGNNDPTEGVADVDGDGRANFIDSDNDNDGSNDQDEIAAGFDPNLRTPFVSGLTPSQGLTFQPTTVSFTASGLDPGFTLTLGPLTLAPVEVAPGSFQASVGALPVGTRTLTVSNPNGQTRQVVDAFIHADALVGGGDLDLRGAQQVLLNSAGNTYRVSTDGDFVTDVSFPSPGGSLRWDGSGRVAGLVCRSVGASACQIGYVRDADGDFDLADETLVPLETVTNLSMFVPRLVFDAAGRAAGGYLKRASSGGGPVTPVVFHDRDGDGAFTGPNERVELGTLSSPNQVAGAAAFDASGRLAFLYGQAALANSIIFAYDRTGDGDFVDAGESIVVPFGSTPACFGATFDGHGHIAMLYGIAGSALHVRRDLNDDTSFAGVAESSSLPASNNCAIGTGPGVDLAISHVESGAVRVLRDLNGDLDFADGDESRLLVTVSPPVAQSLRVGAAAQVFVSTASALAITAP